MNATIAHDTLSISALAAAHPADAPNHTPTIDVIALFTQHREHLLRFVGRYLRNEADAEDVVQNTFIEAMRCAGRYSGLSKPSTWLFGIALNLARSQVRKNSHDVLDLVDDSVLEQYADEYADPAKLTEVRQIVALVGQAMDKLPRHIRTTFESVLEGERSYEEAARELAIPVGTLRSRVSRVRASVRSQFCATKN